MVVFPVEGQGVALSVLLSLLLSQVGVGVVVAEPRPVLIPFPTDWRAERAGMAGQPSQPTPTLPWPPRSHLPLPLPEACASPDQGQVPGWGWGRGRRGQVCGPHSLSFPLFRRTHYHRHTACLCPPGKRCPGVFGDPQCHMPGGRVRREGPRNGGKRVSIIGA